MRLLPSLLFILGLGPSALAQDHFQRAFGPLLPSGEFQVAGAVRHGNGAWTMRASDPDVSSVLRIGPDGNDLWLRQLASTQFSTFGGISNLADAPANGVLVIRTDSLQVVDQDLSERSFDVIKLNSAGAVEWAWQHTFIVPQELFVPSDDHAIAAAPDGSFYVDGGEPARPLLFRFTANGQLSWVKELVATHPIGHVRSLATDAAGSCILLADGSTAFGDQDRVVLMKIAPTGTVQWSFIMQPFATGRSFLPAKAIARANGHTLISGSEYGNGTASFGMLIDLDMTGTLAWARHYAFNGDQSLNTYTADERSDGHLWLDFQEGGYGLSHLTAEGEVLEAERFTYQVSGNSVGVVEWQRKLVHQDHLGLVGDYFIDQAWTFDDPSCDWLWDLDAMDPDLCGTDPVTITSTPLSPQDIIIANGPTVQAATLSSQAIIVTSISAPAAPNTSACAIILSVQGSEATDALRIMPTVLSRGGSVRVNAAGTGLARLLDAMGRVVIEVPVQGGAATLPTDACAPGLHIVQVVNTTGRPVGSTRLVVH